MLYIEITQGTSRCTIASASVPVSMSHMADTTGRGWKVPEENAVLLESIADKTNQKTRQRESMPLASRRSRRAILQEVNTTADSGWESDRGGQGTFQWAMRDRGVQSAVRRRRMVQSAHEGMCREDHAFRARNVRQDSAPFILKRPGQGHALREHSAHFMPSLLPVPGRTRDLAPRSDTRVLLQQSSDCQIRMKVPLQKD